MHLYNHSDYASLIMLFILQEQLYKITISLLLDTIVELTLKKTEKKPSKDALLGFSLVKLS